MEGLLDDIFKFASLVPRVAKHLPRTDYLAEVDDIIELAEIREEILRRVDAVINQVQAESSSGQPFCKIVMIISGNLAVWSIPSCDPRNQPGL